MIFNRKKDFFMESEIYAYFSLIGKELDPEEITAKTGIIPTKTWRVGDLINLRAKLRKKHSGWSVYSSVEKTADLEEHLKSILALLQRGWLPLVELSKCYKAEIACVIYYRSGSVPAIHFDKSIIDKVHQLNAEIDVDFYVLPEEMMAS
jgi:hypothetical protein